MDELVQFLRARLDEDEQAARAATPGPWWADSSIHTEAIYGSGNTDVVAGARWSGEGSVFGADEDAAHIVRHDPARVLRDIEARREILSLHGGDLATQPMFCGHCEHDTPCPTLCLLASVYADHPDFRAEWRP